MIKQIEIRSKEVAKEVLKLQRVSYQVEAEYIGTNDIPPLKETLGELVNCGENFLGYMAEERFAGVLSYKLDKGIVDIHRVMVHPDYFRRGIAKDLIGYLELMYPAVGEMIVSTGAKNNPAVQLYLKLGFERLEDKIYSDHIHVANFAKKKKRDSG